MYFFNSLLIIYKIVIHFKFINFIIIYSRNKNGNIFLYFFFYIASKFELNFNQKYLVY